MLVVAVQVGAEFWPAVEDGAAEGNGEQQRRRNQQPREAANAWPLSCRSLGLDLGPKVRRREIVKRPETGVQIGHRSSPRNTRKRFLPRLRWARTASGLMPVRRAISRTGQSA